MVELSKRLTTIAQQVKKDSKIADIGSDHAYLPIYLVEKGIVTEALAGEVAIGPYNRTKEKVEDFNLGSKIDVRFGDGLEIIQAEDKINTILICGMGGELIRDILSRGIKNNSVNHSKRLILQPNVSEDLLRKFLQENKYIITEEKIVEENKKMYEIIVAEPADKQVTYTSAEIKFGPKLLGEKSRTFIKKWTHELNKLENIIEQIKSSNTNQEEIIDELNHQIEEIKEVI